MLTISSVSICSMSTYASTQLLYKECHLISSARKIELYKIKTTRTVNWKQIKRWIISSNSSRILNNGGSALE